MNGRMVIFEHEADRHSDGLTVSDEYVVTEKQGDRLLFATAYESQALDRAEVVRLTDALSAWLALKPPA